jgi:hypothetical protein
LQCDENGCNDHHADDQEHEMTAAEAEAEAEAIGDCL